MTIGGRSATDATVRSNASFEVNVVLDRTQISYTGPQKAPTGEPLALSTLVTNPDDQGGPPVGGVAVSFELSGAGGTQSATATTGADGVASVARIVTLPPGDYELAISTGRNGKHAPATITADIRVPTAAERIQDLGDELTQAGLHTGTERGLSAKLDSAIAALGAERPHVACNTLRAFVNQAQALRGGRLPAATADVLIDEAEGIRNQLGC